VGGAPFYFGLGLQFELERVHRILGRDTASRLAAPMLSLAMSGAAVHRRDNQLS